MLVNSFDCKDQKRSAHMPFARLYRSIRRMTNAIQVRVANVCNPKNVLIKIIPNNKQFSFRFYFCQLCAVGCYVAISLLRLCCPTALRRQANPRYENTRLWFHRFFFALSALKWIARKNWTVQLSENGHVAYMLNEYSFDYEIAYRCLIWWLGKRYANLFTSFDFSNSKKYGRKYWWSGFLRSHLNRIISSILCMCEFPSTVNSNQFQCNLNGFSYIFFSHSIPIQSQSICDQLLTIAIYVHMARTTTPDAHKSNKNLCQPHGKQYAFIVKFGHRNGWIQSVEDICVWKVKWKCSIVPLFDWNKKKLTVHQLVEMKWWRTRFGNRKEYKAPIPRINGWK